jgi:WD40 repeat protein
MSRYVFSFAAHPQQPIIATAAEDGRILLFDMDLRQRIQAIQSHSGTVTALAFNHDGAWIAAGGGWGPQYDYRGEREIRIWDVATGDRTLTFTPPYTEEIRRLCFVGPNDWLIGLTLDSRPIAGWNEHTVARVWSTR